MSRCFRHKCNEEFFVVKFAYLFPYHINLSLYVRLMVMLLLLHRMEFSYSFFSPSGMVEMVMVVCVFFSVSGPLFFRQITCTHWNKSEWKTFHQSVYVYRDEMQMHKSTKNKWPSEQCEYRRPNKIETTLLLSISFFLYNTSTALRLVCSSTVVTSALLSLTA